MPAAEPHIRSAAEADYTFQAGSLTADQLKVIGFTGSEGLSELYVFRVELCYI